MSTDIIRDITGNRIMRKVVRRMKKDETVGEVPIGRERCRRFLP